MERPVGTIRIGGKTLNSCTVDICMALSEFEVKRMEKLVGEFLEAVRPDPEHRHQLDISFRISGQSFEIFEIRPQWRDPDKKIEESVAKATYVKSTKRWRLYWKRADLKWHRYGPFPESDSLEKILDVIDEDKHHCFWG